MKHEDRLEAGGSHRKRQACIAALGVGLLLVVPGLAMPSRPAQTLAGQPTVVVLDLVVGDRAPIRVGIKEGTAAKVTPTGGPRLELVPTTSGDALDLQVIEVAVAPDTDQVTREVVAQLRLDRGTTAKFNAGGVSIGILWIDVRIAPARSAEADPCSECCITSVFKR